MSDCPWQVEIDFGQVKKCLVVNWASNFSPPKT